MLISDEMQTDVNKSGHSCDHYADKGSISARSEPRNVRIGSARSVDVRRPKFVLSRPSSAPAHAARSISRARDRSKPRSSSLRSFDVSHLNLKVEGRAIRSVAYPLRRSNFAKGLPVNPQTGVSSTFRGTQCYTGFSLRPFDTIVATDSESSSHPYYSQLGDDNSESGQGHNLGYSECSAHRNQVLVQASVLKKHANEGADSYHNRERIPNSYSGNLAFSSQHSENAESFWLKPGHTNGSQGSQRTQFSSSGKDRSESVMSTDDGSESTVVSLGRRIQIMATSDSSRQQDMNQQNNTYVPTAESHWDSDWQELLQHNHNLLLKMSNRDEDHLSTSDCDSGDTWKCAASGKLNSVKSGGISWLDETVRKQENELLVLNSVNKRGEIILHNAEDTESVASDVSECILEDIAEENGTGSESPQLKLPNRDEQITITINGTVDIDKTVEENRFLFDELQKQIEGAKSQWISSSGVLGTTKIPTLKMDACTIEKSDVGSLADLPSYHSGATTSCIVRTRWPKESARMRKQPSQDLVDALQMLEDEEQRDHQLDNTILWHGSSDNCTHLNSSKSSEQRRGNDGQLNDSAQPHQDISIAPPIQVLVEKVVLFAHDLGQRWMELDESVRKSELTQQVLEAEKLLEQICVQEGVKLKAKVKQDLHLQCEEMLRKSQKDYEERIQKDLDLIRKLLDDKKCLTDECEKLHCEMRLKERKNADKIKLMTEKHGQEIANIKERISLSEQEKREKWTQQKTKVIKESTYRGVETKMKDLLAKHRDEMSQIKAQHWDALREAQEQTVVQLRMQEEELKKKFNIEKEEVLLREREREQQRLDLELRQNEHHLSSRLETLVKQHDREIKNVLEEHQRLLEKLAGEQEGALRETGREKERVREELEEKLRAVNRNHEQTLTEIRQHDEKSRREWQQAVTKECDEQHSKKDAEMRERLRRQRDSEIKRVIKEIQQEAIGRQEEDRMAYEGKFRNLRERYESELAELERSERSTRSRYLEIKSSMAQKEEEIVYLRARLHSHDLELCELQHMFHPPNN